MNTDKRDIARHTRDLAARMLQLAEELREFRSGRLAKSYSAEREQELLDEIRHVEHQLKAIQHRHRKIRKKPIKFQMSELALSLPSIHENTPGVNPWDHHRVDEWAATSGSVTPEALLAVQFVLAVWNTKHDWKCGTFNLFDAMRSWDAMHKEVMLRWIESPFFP